MLRSPRIFQLSGRTDGWHLTWIYRCILLLLLLLSSISPPEEEQRKLVVTQTGLSEVCDVKCCVILAPAVGKEKEMAPQRTKSVLPISVVFLGFFTLVLPVLCQCFFASL